MKFKNGNTYQNKNFWREFQGKFTMEETKDQVLYQRKYRKILMK